MAEPLISVVLDQLFSIIRQQAAHELNLLTGVEDEVQTLTSNLQAIKAVLEDAEKRQVNDSAIKLWLDKLKDVSYDIDDVLDDCNTAILKRQIQQEFGAKVQEHAPLPKKVLSSFTLSSCFSCFHQVVLRHGTAVKIKELNKALAVIANEKSRYNFTAERATHHEKRIITTSVFDESEVLVREEDEKKIKDMLLSDHSSSQEASTPLRIISIVGMGGLGKTTLARKAFNDAEVEDNFEQKMWVCVANPFDEGRIAFEILETLIEKKPDLVGRDNILRQINKLVFKKKILLVLDDVWTEDSSDWEQLKSSLMYCSSGSRVLVTTRNQMVALKGMGTRKRDIFSLGKLSEDKCWSLFCRLAFVERTTEERNNLEDIGRKFVERCQGLPLAVKIIGSLLRFKTGEQWQSVLDSKMWEIEDFAKGAFPPILLSYNDLTPILKQCFSYCAIFPKDYVIKKEKLIKLWMAQGFLKEEAISGIKTLGEDYYKKLAMRSLFQDFEKNDDGDVIGCKMHDIVHDFTQSLMKRECLLIEIGNEKKTMLDPSLNTIRHSMLIVEREDTFPTVEVSWQKLRTLLIKPNLNFLKSTFLINLLNLVGQLTCLRTLDLAGLQLQVLPKEIGKLIHLRYLDLSLNSLEMLPPALCELCNLQTLDITGCERLKELPYEIGKLINLKHLENERTNLYFMPKGLDRLTRLETLRQFHSGFMGTLKSKSCSLKGLGMLTHLRGPLTLYLKIGEVAPLSAMTDLQELTLSFSTCKMQDEAFILRALQPPPNIGTLCIQHSNLPLLFSDWLMSVTKLKNVQLSFCGNLESLPPLGKLPCLEHLSLFALKKVKKVGEEFLGIEGQDLGQSSSSSSSSSLIAFPKLKILEFQYLRKWEEWEYGSILSKSGGCNITIMPLLSSLTVLRCPLLKSLPQHLLQSTSTLQTLKIWFCPILEKHYKVEGNDKHAISQIPTVRFVYPLILFLLASFRRGFVLVRFSCNGYLLDNKKATSGRVQSNRFMLELYKIFIPCSFSFHVEVFISTRNTDFTCFGSSFFLSDRVVVLNPTNG